MDLAQALTRGMDVAGSVRSASLDVQAKGLQAEALSNLNGPAVSLSGFAGRVSTSFNLDISRLSAAANPLIAGLDAAAGLDIPPLPNTLSTTREFNLSSVGVSANWPVYTGGRLEAVRGVAQARIGEAQAELQEAQDKAASTTVQRYFQLQLAQWAAKVRGDAVDGIAEHQRQASRLESAGLISTADRLRADVALDGAKRELSKARSDVEIAGVALRRQLAAETDIRPTTPLFVHSQPVGGLQSFIDLGMAHHPAWRKLASKRDQADQAVKLSGSEFSPMVFGVGNYNFNKGDDKLVQPNWYVGVFVSIPLFGHVDHGKSALAAKLDRQRVDETAEQAKRDIPTLIESQWRAMENARAQVLSMDSTLKLARESLRLQTVAFSQQQATTLDVTDARLSLAKNETERAQAAYEYVMSLSRLLEACGQPERLPEYARSADITFTLE
ncbi:TolC family protein [Ideonella sp. DXS29W]|uniref:TolC family protein n=1 Tax=Ideonella lacteola TaxID=2984193 RepID=A0ABU9BSK9_9BURK